MARFDKFDAQRKAVPEVNGHILPSIESSADLGTSEHMSPSQSEKQKRESTGVESKTTPSAKKHPQESDDDDLSDVKDSPPPKKRKKVVEPDSDAAYAAKLQAQENSRIRSTRGGGSKPNSAKKKKIPRKKTSAKVKAEDDSDLDGSGSEVKEKKVNRSGGFHVSSGRLRFSGNTELTSFKKELMLSPALSALLDNEIKVKSLAVICLGYFRIDTFH